MSHWLLLLFLPLQGHPHSSSFSQLPIIVITNSTSVVADFPVIVSFCAPITNLLVLLHILYTIIVIAKSMSVEASFSIHVAACAPP